MKSQNLEEKIKALKDTEKKLVVELKDYVNDTDNIEKVKSLAEIFHFLGNLTAEIAPLSNDLKHYTDSAVFYQYALTILEERINPVLQSNEVFSFTESDIKSDITEKLNELKRKMLNTIRYNEEKNSILEKDINDETLENKKILSQLRLYVSENIDKEESEKLHKYITIKLKEFLAKLYKDTKDEIGTEPCEYAILGFGSMASEQMTPYSDLEFGILVERKDDNITKYFKNLTHLVHLKIICLGETIIPNNKYGVDLRNLVHKGINFDLGDKTPLNSMSDRWKPYDLIQTIDGMLYYMYNQDEKISNIDMFLPYILEKTCYIYGNETLVTEYQSKTNNFLFEQLDSKGNHNCKARSLKVWDGILFELDYSKLDNSHTQFTIEGNLDRFYFTLSRLYTDTLDIKQEVYRIADRLLYGLGMYYGINCNSIWKTINELYIREFINEEAKNNFTTQVNFCTNLRLKVYSSKGSHTDKIILNDIFYKELQKEGLLKYFNITQNLNTIIRKFCENWTDLSPTEKSTFFKNYNFNNPPVINHVHIANRMLDVPKTIDFLKSTELSPIERLQALHTLYLSYEDNISNHTKFSELSAILHSINYTQDKGIPAMIEKIVAKESNNSAILIQYALFLFSTFKSRGQTPVEAMKYLEKAMKISNEDILVYTKDNYKCADNTIQNFMHDKKINKVEIIAKQYAYYLYILNRCSIDKKLLQDYSDVLKNSKNDTGYYLLYNLYKRIDGSSKYIVRWLVDEKETDFFAINSHDTVLHQAVSGGNEEIIKLILNKIKEKFNQDLQQIYQFINAKDYEGDTPLMWAVEGRKINVVKILLEYGVDIDVQNNGGMTAVHWAVEVGYLDIIKCLVEKRANVEAKDNNGGTVLHWAAKFGKLDVVKWLVEHVKADVNATDKDNKTPLDLAKAKKHEEIIKLLEDKKYIEESVEQDKSATTSLMQYESLLENLDKSDTNALEAARQVLENTITIVENNVSLETLMGEVQDFNI